MKSNRRVLIHILKHPPQKAERCRRCSGRGIINCRGMILSDPCPDCMRRNGTTGTPSGTGVVQVVDYTKWAEIILERLKGGD
jgi:hypothetical protein